MDAAWGRESANACVFHTFRSPPRHTLHRLHANSSHVESLNLLKEAARMLGVHLTYPKPSEKYAAGFLDQERHVLAAMAAYVAARPICTLWDLSCFLAKQQDQDSYEKLLVGDGLAQGALPEGICFAFDVWGSRPVNMTQQGRHGRILAWKGRAARCRLHDNVAHDRHLAGTSWHLAALGSASQAIHSHASLLTLFIVSYSEAYVSHHDMVLTTL